MVVTSFFNSVEAATQRQPVSVAFPPGVARDARRLTKDVSLASHISNHRCRWRRTFWRSLSRQHCETICDFTDWAIAEFSAKELVQSTLKTKGQTASETSEGGLQ